MKIHHNIPFRVTSEKKFRGKGAGVAKVSSAGTHGCPPWSAKSWLLALRWRAVSNTCWTLSGNTRNETTSLGLRFSYQSPCVSRRAQNEGPLWSLISLNA